MQNLAEALSCPKYDILRIYLTNLGKYNEGELIGEWVSLPISHDELQLCLQRIQVDGAHYEEYFMTDYDSDITGLTKVLSEYESIKTLNQLAMQVSELGENDVELFSAVIETGLDASSSCDIINLINNLSSYRLLSDVHDESDLGYYWIEESGCYDLSVLGDLAYYIDYEKFGRDIVLQENGTFSSKGYISRD